MINDSDGFMDGFSAPIPTRRTERAHKATPVIAPWSPGQTQIPALVLCCPHCGSVEVKARDNGKGELTVRWECQTCAQSFRIPREDSARAVTMHGMAP